MPARVTRHGRRPSAARPLERASRHGRVRKRASRPGRPGRGTTRTRPDRFLVSTIRVVACSRTLSPVRCAPNSFHFPLPPHTRREGEEQATASSSSCRRLERVDGMATSSSGDDSSDLVPPSYPEASLPSPSKPYLFLFPFFLFPPDLRGPSRSAEFD
ncbi:hypothetical protein EJB05_04918, partial [Eragrostis curvula]